MAITHVPLLAHIRPLYDLPRDPAVRFPFYIAAVRANDVIGCPPLVAYNPMGKEHIGVYMDALLAAQVDILATEWILAVPSALRERLGAVRHGIAVVDDVLGGWTERSAYEMNERFPQIQAKATAGWLTTMLYASEPMLVDVIAHRVQATIIRAAIRSMYGPCQTLAQMLMQEHRVYQYTAAPYAIDAEEYAYTDAVIGAYAGAIDYPTQVAVLLGDDFARRNGFPPQGFGAYAGLAWAAQSPRERVVALLGEG